MPKSTFRCARCGRTFSMAAHLARHQSAAHGVGGRKKSRPANGRKKRRGRPPGRRSAAQAGGMGGEMTSRIISDMSSYLQDLNARREAISEQIAGIENAMNMLGGSRMTIPGGPAVGRRGPGRPKGRRGPGRPRGKRGPGRPKGSRGREGSLKPMIVQALRTSPGPMSPGEIADAVIKGGYQTKTANLTKAVSNALPDIREARKVGRGQYSA